MAHNLSASQKEEIRRLTQLANRRIKASSKAWEKWGGDIAPKELAGNHQIKEQWNTSTSPLSRSVKFESKADYLQQLKYLKSFEHDKMNVTEYKKLQIDKLNIAVTSATGEYLSPAIQKKLDKMNPVELSNFWDKFNDNARKLGVKYSSGDNMEHTLTEFFKEDIDNLFEVGE